MLFACFVAPLQALAVNKESTEVVIDPGHSPARPGATSCTGKPEYRYNDSLADVVKSLLAKRQITVDLTRKPGREISLAERANAARGKRLLLSIHHDSVQPQFISWKKRGIPTSSKAQGYSIFISRRNGHYKESLEYARILGKSLVRKGLRPTLHHAENIAGENRELLDPVNGIYILDDLVVLKNSESPAVLLEAAVIVNLDDEKRASSAQYQNTIAEAVLDMVTRK